MCGADICLRSALLKVGIFVRLFYFVDGLRKDDGTVAHCSLFSAPVFLYLSQMRFKGNSVKIVDIVIIGRIGYLNLEVIREVSVTKILMLLPERY